VEGTVGRGQKLLVDAAMKVAELHERRHDLDRPMASPRAARLRDLEEAPPAWLRGAIGTCPYRSKSNSATILAWRRAALAIDDYRVDHRYDSREDAIGGAPSDPAQRTGNGSRTASAVTRHARAGLASCWTRCIARSTRL
jgi:hypothetical protein